MLELIWVWLDGGGGEWEKVGAGGSYGRISSPYILIVQEKLKDLRCL